MLEDTNLDKESARIDMYLDALDEQDHDKFIRSAQFVNTHFTSDDNPETDPIAFQVAANYLKWVLSKGTPREEYLRTCKCVGGWIEKDDGTVYPCDRCRPEQNEQWWKEKVDEDWSPR